MRLSERYLVHGRITVPTVGRPESTNENLKATEEQIAAVPMGNPPGEGASDRQIVAYIISEWRRHNQAGVAPYPWNLPGLGYLRPLNLCVPNIDNSQLKSQIRTIARQTDNEYTPAGTSACRKFSWGGYDDKEANTYGLIPNALANPVKYLNGILEQSKSYGTDRDAPKIVQELTSWRGNRKWCGNWCDHEVNATQVMMNGLSPFNAYQSSSPQNIGLWLMNYTMAKQAIANKLEARRTIRRLEQNIEWYEKAVADFREQYGDEETRGLLRQTEPLAQRMREAVDRGQVEQVANLRAKIAERLAANATANAAMSANRELGRERMDRVRTYVEERDSIGDQLGQSATAITENAEKAFYDVATGLANTLGIPNPKAVVETAVMGGLAGAGAGFLVKGLTGLLGGGILGAIGGGAYSVFYGQQPRQ